MNVDRLSTQTELHGKPADPFIQDGGHSLSISLIKRNRFPCNHTASYLRLSVTSS